MVAAVFGSALALRNPRGRRHGCALEWSPWRPHGAEGEHQPALLAETPTPGTVGVPTPGRLSLCSQPLAYLPFSSPQVKCHGRAPAPPHRVEIDVVE